MPEESQPIESSNSEPLPPSSPNGVPILDEVPVPIPHATSALAAVASEVRLLAGHANDVPNPIILDHPSLTAPSLPIIASSEVSSPEMTPDGLGPASCPRIQAAHAPGRPDSPEPEAIEGSEFKQFNRTSSSVVDVPTPVKPKTALGKVMKWFSICGPGLVVMLADTDAGCLITAAETGSTWGYSMLWIQVLLILVIFMAQELTARLGTYTGLGHGELIHKHFGRVWAWLSASTLVIACCGALVSEMSGVVGIGKLFGIPPAASACTAAALLTIIVVTGKYRHVEKVALLLGMFEFAYFITMAMTFDGDAFKSSVGHIDFSHSDYSYMVSANIGAVVMPWMIFYQQSAIVDKGLIESDLNYLRYDTLIGSFFTQLIMGAVICTMGGAIWAKEGMLFPNDKERDIHDFSEAIESVVGTGLGRALFSMGMLGGALIGAIVVALTAAWGLGEVAGYKHSLEHNPKDAPWFYIVFGFCVAIGVGIVLSPVNLVVLNVIIQVMNALLLPVVLGLLYKLAVHPHILPEKVRLRGWYRWFSLLIYTIVAAFGVGGGVYGLATGKAA